MMSSKLWRKQGYDSNSDLDRKQLWSHREANKMITWKMEGFWFYPSGYDPPNKAGRISILGSGKIILKSLWIFENSRDMASTLLKCKTHFINYLFIYLLTDRGGGGRSKSLTEAVLFKDPVRSCYLYLSSPPRSWVEPCCSSTRVSASSVGSAVAPPAPPGLSSALWQIWFPDQLCEKIYVSLYLNLIVLVRLKGKGITKPGVHHVGPVPVCSSWQLPPSGHTADTWPHTWIIWTQGDTNPHCDY